MRFPRRALARAMNPYRLAFRPAALQAAGSRFLRSRWVRGTALAGLSVVLFGWVPFGAGWISGQRLAAAPASPSAPLPLTPEACPTIETDPSPPATESARRKAYAISPAQARATIAARAREIAAILDHRDAAALARLVDPDDGLQLASLDESEEVRLSAAELSRCFADRTKRMLSESTAATCAEVWKEHLALTDRAGAPIVDYNLPSSEGRPRQMLTGGAEEDPTVQAHGDSIVAQYVVRRPETDESDRGWSTLRLVFDPRGEQWRLTAAIWNDWTPASDCH
jgi:hypothetical protein